MVPSHFPEPIVRQVVYTSEMSPELGVEAIGQIMQLSRLRNPGIGLTGALLFDGARFAQLLEGDPDVLGRLMTSIERDPRHNGFTSVLDATGVRRCRNWVAGYVESDQFDAFGSSVAAGEVDALTSFVELLKGADVI